jgi:hypothetical protein
MADALKLSEISVLFALMAEAGEVSNVDLAERYGFTLTGESRKRLNDRKLVDSRRVGRSYVHELTEQGWARCHDELSAACPPRAGAAGGALYALLRGLERYLGRAKLSLADVFRVDESTVDPESAIRSAYARTPRQPGGWVALTDLRPLLGATPRAAVDEALTRMNRQTGVSLVPGENHKTLTEADRAAAVTVGGRPYHFLLIEGA